ncbi:MAG: hypothetical protein M4579_006348 [Chaenotheca gracillima]|nr:MAG: hypothetical protein M4579_006348 [Chaenotheca gracillima]
MIHARRLVSTREALRRVFIDSTAAKNQPTRPHAFAVPRCSASLQQSRNYAQKKAKPGIVNRPPRNEEIQNRMVAVVDNENHLKEPQLLREVLAGLDRSTQVLLQVAQTSPDEPPICKIMDKKTLQESERAKAKPKKPQTSTKELEINWAIDQNDLGHRLDRLQQFLEKGMKVEILLANRRRKRKATVEEAQNTLKMIRERVEECSAKESKPPDGKILGEYLLVIEKKPG